MSRIKREQWRLFLAVLLVGVYRIGYGAEQVPSDWKTECVGRYQINVPGEIEIALTTMRKLRNPNDPFPYRFSDGTSAPHSGFDGMEISEKISKEEFEKFKKFTFERYEKTREKLLQEAESTDSKLVKQDALQEAAESKALQFKEGNMFGWEFLGGMHLYQFYDGHIYFSRTSGKKNLTPEAISALKSNADEFDRAIAQANLDSFLKAFRPRKLYEMPTGTGICMPYAFIADEGTGRRSVGVMMRLKDNPDIEIFLQDESAYKPSSGPDRNAKEEIAFFWQWMNRDVMKEVRLGFPSFHSVKLDGRDGVYTFAEIIRPDDSRDYGYVAYVKGDPEAATDMPNLMVYVIRTAAKAKGKPVSKAELKNMAKKIAASIKRHH